MASPLQSAYAELRQRLIANPGVALATIFMDAFGHRKHLMDYAPRKHCPDCAKGFFHSQLFDYTWLERCPAHGTLLLDRCEECGQRWPRSSALSDRSCPGCGVPDWDDVRDDAQPTPEQLARIARVQCFVDDTSSGFDFWPGPPYLSDLCYAYLWDSLLRYTWPECVTKDIAAFPAFQLAITSGHSQAELETLGVVFPDYPVVRMTSPLRRLNLRPPSKATWYDRLKRDGPIRRPSPKAQRIIEQSFNDILAWCHSHHEADHQLKLGDFRYFGFEGLVNDGRYLCPFCLGVSAWWEAVTQKYFSPWQCSTPTEYGWTNVVQWSIWPDTPDRLLMEDGDGAYWRPTPRFEERYYERSLLLLFAELYQSAVHLLNRLEAAEVPYRPGWDSKNFYTPGRFTAAQCLWRITEDQTIEWVWPEVHPLAQLDSPRPSTKTRICGGTWSKAVEPGAEALLSDLGQDSDVAVSSDTILQTGALFHTGCFEYRTRRHSWTILERPPSFSLYYPSFARSW